MAKKKTDRPLTDADKAIWKKVARTVTPSKRAKDIFAELFGEGTHPPPFEKGPYMRVVAKPKKSKQVDLPALEPSGDKRIRRGRLEIDKKIDLHDMTRDQAETYLMSAIRNAYSNELKTLLVVTGKGPRLEGVLRTAFPGWINSPELRPLIAAYAPAHIRHGGSGAWYVFLKRRT